MGCERESCGKLHKTWEQRQHTETPERGMKENIEDCRALSVTRSHSAAEAWLTNQPADGVTRL